MALITKIKILLILLFFLCLSIQRLYVHKVLSTLLRFS